jgi:hypothetical protein
MRQQHGSEARAYVDRQIQGMKQRKNAAAAASWQAVMDAIDAFGGERHAA